MVILIGAESSTGKTLMAQRLLEIYKIPYLSVDHIKMGLYRADENCGFKPDDDNDIIEARLWPILKGIVETAIENNQSMIIEGCYLYPNRMSEFSSECRSQIIPVFMGFSAEYLRTKFDSDVLRYRSAIEQRDEEDRTVDWFIEANEAWKVRCKESGIRYFEIQNDYNADIDKIYEWIATEAERIRSTL
jgi:putative acetyltransferase